MEMTRRTFTALTAAVAAIPTVSAGARNQGGKRWYKGQLHTHTCWSDGRALPEQAAQAYLDAGYDFLAITDHNRIGSDPDRWMPVGELGREWPPKVIDTPPVAAVAKDGIQLIAKARVTVRANIKQLVGGAGEDTILARVGEGIVSSIGSAESHKQVLENPDSISKLVLSKGLDDGTAFEILSIDIADIDVGKNIGAQLQMDQAEADKNIAQAKAEERRAMAIANEQEMKAKAQEARAKVIEAEALVPQAMAEAFKNGNLGIMDYYRMQNIQADTAMRETISKPKAK